MMECWNIGLKMHHFRDWIKVFGINSDEFSMGVISQVPELIKDRGKTRILLKKVLGFGKPPLPFTMGALLPGSDLVFPSLLPIFHHSTIPLFQL